VALLASEQVAQNDVEKLSHALLQFSTQVAAITGEVPKHSRISRTRAAMVVAIFSAAAREAIILRCGYLSRGRMGEMDGPGEGAKLE
jgi:hypothetical protein